MKTHAFFILSIVLLGASSNAFHWQKHHMPLLIGSTGGTISSDPSIAEEQINRFRLTGFNKQIAEFNEHVTWTFITKSGKAVTKTLKPFYMILSPQIAAYFAAIDLRIHSLEVNLPKFRRIDEKHNEATKQSLGVFDDPAKVVVIAIGSTSTIGSYVDEMGIQTLIYDFGVFPSPVKGKSIIKMMDDLNRINKQIILCSAISYVEQSGPVQPKAKLEIYDLHEMIRTDQKFLTLGGEQNCGLTAHMIMDLIKEKKKFPPIIIVSGSRKEERPNFNFEKAAVKKYFSENGVGYLSSIGRACSFNVFVKNQEINNTGDLMNNRRPQCIINEAEVISYLKYGPSIFYVHDYLKRTINMIIESAKADIESRYELDADVQGQQTIPVAIIHTGEVSKLYFGILRLAKKAEIEKVTKLPGALGGIVHEYLDYE